MDSGSLRVARGGSGAKTPALAACPTRFLMREHSKLETPLGGGGSFDHLVVAAIERARANEETFTGDQPGI